MPTKTLAPTPSRLNKPGQLWRDDRPFAEAVAAAFAAFQAKYNGYLPESVYCGDPIPEDYPPSAVPVYHDGTAGAHCYWLEFPEGMDGRTAGGR